MVGEKQCWHYDCVHGFRVSWGWEQVVARAMHTVIVPHVCGYPWSWVILSFGLRRSASGDGAAPCLEIGNRNNKPLKARHSRGFLEKKVMPHFYSAAEHLTDSLELLLLHAGRMGWLDPWASPVAWDTEWEGQLVLFGYSCYRGRECIEREGECARDALKMIEWAHPRYVQGNKKREQCIRNIKADKSRHCVYNSYLIAVRLMWLEKRD